MDDHDDYDYRAILDCGCTFGFYDHGGEPIFKPGFYVGCEKHSVIYGYDPDNGYPKYERDRKVVDVQPPLAQP